MAILRIRDEVSGEVQEILCLRGKSGTSPTVTVEPIDGGNRIKITDVNDEKSIDVMNGTITAEQIASAIEIYFSENPIVHECDVKTVNGKTGNVTLSARDVGALPSDTVIPSIDGLAKESFVESTVASAITAYDTEAMALLGEDGDSE